MNSIFPKRLLIPAFVSLVSVLAAPLYLFGNVQLIAPSTSGFVNVLIYIVQNLLWLAPVVLFFFSLELHRHEHERLALALALVNVLIAAAALVLPFL